MAKVAGEIYSRCIIAEPALDTAVRHALNIKNAVNKTWPEPYEIPSNQVANIEQYYASISVALQELRTFMKWAEIPYEPNLTPEE